MSNLRAEGEKTGIQGEPDLVLPYSPSDISGMIEKVSGEKTDPARLRIITDTSNFFQVDYNDVVSVGEDLFLVRGMEREGRFGLDEEPKHWVKKVIDLRTGERKVLKLAFFETFKGKVGSLEYTFFRSPQKEGRILEKVRGHPHFMQGYSLPDEKGNVLRVLDYVHGKTIHALIAAIEEDHETYYYTLFPPILESLIKAYEAIGFLHRQGEMHGDIRRDHLIAESSTGLHVWIDFDYAYKSRAAQVGFDLFGLGNVLAYVVGKGDVNPSRLKRSKPDIYDSLRDEDLNIIFAGRVVNLRKVYPYIPERMNRVLLHFSKGTEIFYESVEELLNDLRSCLAEMPWG